LSRCSGFSILPTPRCFLHKPSRVPPGQQLVGLVSPAVALPFPERFTSSSPSSHLSVFVPSRSYPLKFPNPFRRFVVACLFCRWFLQLGFFLRFLSLFTGIVPLVFFSCVAKDCLWSVFLIFFPSVPCRHRNYADLFLGHLVFPPLHLSLKTGFVLLWVSFSGE